ncbi:hypothetical protein PIB30_083357 [Stylosanthes scabra]|uniref:Uncharacterized protein n=1 Tax=Stylosanthes scabra TaxID=79078 RepID=A0ABU6XRK9_9FABA|nr:hypothetical protein [Stylosanthes scabra]
MEERIHQQHNEIIEMRSQIKEWTKNASSREAYCCWAHQQANPNLVQIPIHDIPKFAHDNAAKGRHIFQGALKTHEQGEPLTNDPRLLSRPNQGLNRARVNPASPGRTHQWYTLHRIESVSFKVLLLLPLA